MADAYVVVFAALMLPAGLLGDRFGRRLMLIAGLGIFLAGSVVGALAGDVNAVIVARAVMGVGGALVTPLALSVLPSLFGPDERTKAVGIISAASALGLPLGPIIGGWLLNHFWWGSVFLVNVPMAAIGITACVFLLPETRDPASPKVDTVSTALTAGGLGALIYAIIEAPTRGWGDPLVLGMFGAAVVLLAGLVLRERRTERPMLDMTLLAQRGFLFNTVAATLVMFVLSGLLFVLPPYLQAVLGHDAFGTGLRLLPMMGGLPGRLPHRPAGRGPVRRPRGGQRRPGGAGLRRAPRQPYHGRLRLRLHRAVALDRRARLRLLADPGDERRPGRPAPRPGRLGVPPRR